LWPNPDARLFGGAQRLATNYFQAIGEAALEIANKAGEEEQE
jgi:hypothetical protein